MPISGGVSEVEVINEVQLVAHTAWRDGAVESDGDLSVKVQSFFYDLAGIYGKFPGALAQPVVDDDTNFVFFDNTETLVINTTGYATAQHIRLARVITQSGIIVRIILERAFLTASGGNDNLSIEEYTDDDASDTTPDTAFVQALRHTTASLPAGDYLISWSFEVKNDTLNGLTRTRVQLDDSDDLAFADCAIVLDTTAEVTVAGQVRRALSGVHTIDIDFFPFTGTTGEVRRKRISIRRVA